jgi:lysozyme
MLTTSPAGYDLIKRFEGCEKRLPDNRLQSYKIGADPWTVGWGQTGQMPDGRPVVEGLIITQQEADDALAYFVRAVVEPLARKHFVCQTQSEFDAVVSFIYNTNHGKLERGEYSLPQMVNLKARDTEALVNLWLRYVATPGFENGLYKRRIAEVLMFLGLPWNAPAVWGFISTAKYKQGGVVNPTDPWFILSIAEKAVEAVNVPPPIVAKPVPPKAPAAPPKPAAAPAAPDAPKAETKPAATVKKPPSPNTKAPAEVGLDPNAGLKHISESERAKGWYWRSIGVMLLRFSTLGMFGNGAMIAGQTLMADQMLLNAAFELWVPLAVNGGTLVTGYVAAQYGAFKEYQGRLKGSQALYV